MKVVVCNGPGELRSITKEPPVQQKRRAILRIKRIGICGTDIHAFEGTQPYFNYPRVLGHELAGELVDADNTYGFNPGDNVTLLPYWSCGACIACRSGKPNCCIQLQVCGVHVDGGMAEYISVPSDSLVQGSGLTLDELALVEPLAIGAHGVRRAGIKHGEFILVVGAGPIGLGIMQFCKLAGATVIAMDIHQQRLEFCRKQIGVPYIVNPSRVNALEEIRTITSNDMPTAVFDATGNQQAINSSLAFLAHGGRYILVGLQKGDICLSHPEFHKRESTLMSSRNALREDFEYVISSVQAKVINPATLITHRLSFSDLEDQFVNVIRSNELVVKAMVDVG